jgi:hypothetical protein
MILGATVRLGGPVLSALWLARSHHLHGRAKVGWLPFELVFPVLDSLSCLIFPALSMHGCTLAWSRGAAPSKSWASQQVSCSPDLVPNALHPLGEVQDHGERSVEQCRALRGELLMPR